jgi:HSP20 family protein
MRSSVFPIARPPTFRKDLDRLFERFFGDSEPFRAWSGPALAAYPPVNVWQVDECVFVEAELPGLSADDVEITTTVDELVIAGTRPELEMGPKTTVHRRERLTGAFRRSVRLPVPVEPEETCALFDDGVLTVTLPLAREATPRRIAVQTADTGGIPT